MSVLISREGAIARGLPGVTISADAVGAGMSASPPADNDLIAVISGPPGGPLSAMFWAAGSSDLEAEIRSRYSRPIMAPLEIEEPVSVDFLGRKRQGRVFRTGKSYARTSWFSTLVEVQAGRVFVALGVGDPSPSGASAEMILAHPPLAIIAKTLSIE